jgi:hypothetical protein
MKPTVCPFCGVVSESRHDSQEACIHALQSEIDHTRQVLAQTSNCPTGSGSGHSTEGSEEKDFGGN